MKNVVLMFSPTDEKPCSLRAGRVSYGHTAQSVFLKRSRAWTKPERVLMGLL